ncbi:hypothetical protein [Simkania negevensis]|uniref:Uncharacterized protein n=1 Tax=Simkania negevensis (strain ATCC VR-1471 / DSM 27360 / Z) TaxID=331113 RepID=F8L897_SIMNZ|nr:hypothetical protein [Simkania negevensis]MCB1075038.1 hypothetical protein [Simkania sp.]CCB89020.1 unknown protein [Simkania negevensis Z]
MQHPSLPDVHSVNVNHRASWQGAVSHHFREKFRKKYIRNIFFSIVTCGVYPYKKYKKSRHAVAQALAARKLFYFRALQDHIEEARKEQTHTDPRQSLNAIFMMIQSEKVSEDENALEFKAIYSPNEILLFITNPVRDQKSIKLYHLKTERLDYLHMWWEVKRKARVNQYRQIQSINLCNTTLKREHCLTPEGVHDRLTRTAVYRKKSCLLSRFKELSKAFQEIVLAYQDFEELSDSNPELYHFLESLAKTSKKDIEILQTYLASRYLPRDLPLENRRQLIQLGNQQEILSRISEEQELNLCSLILNRYQWDFLLSIQEVSQVTLNLLDWAFEESSTSMKKPLSFLERVYAGAEKKVKNDPENFPSLNEKIQEDPSLERMTVDFAHEINREWPSLQLIDGENALYHLDRCDSLSQESLIQCYHELQKFSGIDDTLFVILQQSVSQVGKTGFRSAIEEGVTGLLGEKSEYFLPILTNTDIAVKRLEAGHIEIHYTFEQVIVKKGVIQHPFEKEKYMVINQPLKQEENHWISLEPKTKIAVKKRLA